MPSFRDLDTRAARDLFDRLGETLSYRAGGALPEVTVRGIVELATERYPDEENAAIAEDAIVASLLVEEVPNPARGDRLERHGAPPLVIDQVVENDGSVVTVVVNEVAP